VRRTLCAAVVLLAGLSGPASAATGPDVSIAPDRTSIRTTLGRDFTFRTTITNRGSRPATGLVAHLNVLSLRGGVYVDPEDWSANRTRYLRPIPARGSTTVSWEVTAVTFGSLGLYVSVLRQDGTGTPATSATVHARIAERKTIDASGIVPLGLGVPAALAALALGIRLRRRRL
jgi:hypothetical protein